MSQEYVVSTVVRGKLVGVYADEHRKYRFVIYDPESSFPSVPFEDQDAALQAGIRYAEEQAKKELATV